MNREDRRGFKKGELDWQRQFFRINPVDVQGQQNLSTIYYRKKLMRMLLGLYELDGEIIDQNLWDMNYFWLSIFEEGFIAITETMYGVIPTRGTFYGQNVFLRPTNFRVVNPALPTDLERYIYNSVGNINAPNLGTKPAVLVHLQDDYTPPWDIINRYAEMLAQCDASISVSLINSRIPFIMMAESESERKTLEAIYDQITIGKPAIFTMPGMREKITTLNPSYSMIADKILDVKRTILNEFLTDIGVNNNNVRKKEREVSDEVNSNNEEVIVMGAEWDGNLRKSVEYTNKCFGTNLRLVKTVDKVRKMAAQMEDAVQVSAADAEGVKKEGEP